MIEGRPLLTTGLGAAAADAVAAPGKYCPCANDHCVVLKTTKWVYIWPNALEREDAFQIITRRRAFVPLPHDNLTAQNEIFPF